MIDKLGVTGSSPVAPIPKSKADCNFRREPADAVRPRDLKKVHEAMIAKNWSRSYISSQVNRVKFMFAYAVEQDMISGTVYHALLTVKGLRKLEFPLCHPDAIEIFGRGWRSSWSIWAIQSNR
jgi:hypothetical protein